MLVLEVITWWYSAGLKQCWQRLGRALVGVASSFSVGQLVRTLFAPWRRIISYDDESIQQRMRASLDNLVSRCVGFSVRVLVLITAGILSIIIIVGGALAIILWVLAPIISAALIVSGLFV